MFLDTLDDAVFVEEVHLVFSGMDVDVDVVRRNLQATAMTKYGKYNMPHITRLLPSWV